MEDWIEIEGARVHNLKNISLRIPRQKLVVITGLSGSGKSSLAFDTIYAEGQRRYLETLSAYARQYIGNMERPDVDLIKGLSPVVAIEQKSVNRNPRSTVGTITEINDYLRVLFSRVSRAYSPITAEEMVHYSDQQIVELLLEKFEGRKIAILATIIKNRRGHYHDLFESLAKRGYIYARIDGELREFSQSERLDRYRQHTIELVIDRLKAKHEDLPRIKKSVAEAMKQGHGTMLVYDYEADTVRYFSQHLMCPTSGISFEEPEPYSFSFNSPQGACPRCNGLGIEAVFDQNRIIPNSELSIAQGGIEPLGPYHKNATFLTLEAIGHRHGFSLSTPIKELSEEQLGIILFGESEAVKVDMSSISIFGGVQLRRWEGVADYISNTQNKEEADSSKGGEKWKEQFISYRTCSKCGGTRLKEEALHFKIGGRNIAQLCDTSISELSVWFSQVESLLSEKEKKIASEILKEIRERLSFLQNVGLGYLTLNRSARSLSGGESQRIRLATQIGSKLQNVLYILDEPSIGLHQKDNHRLIETLKALRDGGNSVIVVEHDEEMMLCSDFIVDVGPKAGKRGGHIVSAGTPKEFLKADTLTARYLSGMEKIPVPKTRRKGSGEFIEIIGARGNNLKNINVRIPLGTFTCITGLSGSGKSTLINDTLVKIVSKQLYRAMDEPLQYDSITGLEHIDKMVVVDQSPIGRSPRSNPATYTGVMNDIRKLFESTPDAKIRGFNAGRFSFNVKGGRCEECHGAGVQTIEMNFLPDVYVKCKACGGKRYNEQTLEVRYKGCNINDVLEMTVNIAVDFFKPIPSIYQKLKAVQDVGLGYLTLGQPCTTLSGGECQRIKLSSELSKKDTGKTLYILDEPTTGLHFEDIKTLLGILKELVDRGNTVIVVEHNMDVIKVADHIIDLGPEGGAKGGRIIAEGTPEQVVQSTESLTSAFLKRVLERN
ncbi:MAG: excinuclease ABC subunit UvrA [Alistipes sp.]|nr:excinuclease ABC subunit UvrA [Candidatus Alistipes equi]